MFKKERSIPAELVILRILDYRINLSEKEKLRLSNKEKGYAGELKFDSLIRDLDTLVINDLLLEVGDTVFQIDTLIIFYGRIYLIDVKNYEGEFCYEDGLFKTIAGSEKKDPMLQLNRCHSELRQLLHKYGYNYPIDAFLVFINPEFTLFQSSPNPQIILPTQVNSFIKKLYKMPSKLSDKHHKLADLLVSLHKTENPYVRLPKYDFDSLHKGLSCGICHSFSLSVSRTILTCKCGFKERVEPAVMRSVNELQILIPEIKITNNLVHEWCDAVASKKTIRRILKENFKAIGNTKESYYE
ncbi:nuclease-related domain-containing protein [Neobacillus sp. NPDC093182]|uniref:nuclease-related domain-containing protein n=1 Tax=Neobacillus sp. NPDC093182 TaxID=3364297 RepID=UPI0038108981